MDEIAFVCFCFLAFWFSDDVFEREAVIEGKRLHTTMDDGK